VRTFGELVYYRRFARRIPAAKLATSTGIVLWGLPLSAAAAALGGLIVNAGGGAAAATAGGPDATAVAVIGLPFFCVGGVASIVFLLWYIRLLLAYCEAFRHAIVAAQQADRAADQTDTANDSPGG